MSRVNAAATKPMTRPCRRGHVGSRYLKGGRCVDCARHFDSLPKTRQYREEYRKSRVFLARREARKFEERLAKKAAYLKRVYGLSVETYNSMLAELNDSGCRICENRGPFSGQLVAIDHDHACCAGNVSCGKCVRGMICARCNRLLGHAKDDSKILRRAAEYLDGGGRVD